LAAAPAHRRPYAAGAALTEGPQDIVPVRTAGHRSALAGLSPQDIVPLQQVI